MLFKNISYSKLALFLSILCITYCIIYESVLVKYEALNNFVYALGIVANCVALSIIASCIFYFVTDYFPKKHQQDQIHNYIISNLESLERIGKNAFLDIVNNSNPTKKEFTDSCNLDLMEIKGSSNQENPLIAKSTNWFEYFNYIQSIETCIIRRLMIFESIIPVEVKLIFIELQKENTIFSNNKLYMNYYKNDKNKRSIKVYANDIYSHIFYLVELKNIYNKTSKI